MQFSLASLTFVTLTLCSKLYAEHVLVREERSIPSAVAKSGASLVAPLISKGLKGALGMGKETFEAYRIAAQKEATSNGWLTEKFVDLLFLPTISLLSNQVRDLEIKIKKQNKEKDDFMVVIISLSAIVPTILLTLILLCMINTKRTNRVRGTLKEQNQSIELLRAAATAAGRGGPAARRTASAQVGAGSSSAGSSASPSLVINFNTSE